MGLTEGPEPMIQLRNQGMVLGEGHEKMSKSRGNVVAPDDLVRRYGADTVRAYLIFFARWDMGAPWDSQGIEGTSRWVRRVWSLFVDSDDSGRRATANADSDDSSRRDLRRKVHQTLQSVTRDFETFEFNTVVSGLMELLNEMVKAREAGAVNTPEWQEAREIYLKMMAPVCPHITEEVWTNVLGKPYSIHQQSWPELDEAATREDEITLPVQVNGKVRGHITVAADASDDQIRAEALKAVARYLDGNTPKKVIVAQRRLVSVVI
jgi:leucyl-tRNA synthetase